MNQESFVALVIENESECPPEVLSFCKHALDTGKFTEVEYNLNSRNSLPMDMEAQLLRADAIVVKSKWLYKDQLEKFVEAFATSLIHKRYSFFIWHFLDDCNRWWNMEDVKDITRPARFRQYLHQIVGFHNVYSIHGKQIWHMFNKQGGGFVAYREKEGDHV